MFGDLILDSHEYFKSYRESPEAQVPVLEEPKVIENLGGAGNLARNLSSLGFEVNLYCLCSTDKKEKIINLLKENKLNFNKILWSNDLESTIKRRIYCNDKYLCRIDKDMKVNANLFKKLSKNYNLDQEIFDDDCVNVLSDYNKGTFNFFNFLSKGKDFSFKYIDPKLEDWNSYKNSKFLKANKKEISECLKHNNLKNEREVKNLFNIDNLIITDGENGSCIYPKDKDDLIKIEPFKIEFEDVSGAGDSFLSGFVWAIENGYNKKSSMHFASACSAVSVSKPNVYAPEFFEILELLDEKLELKSSLNKNYKYLNGLIGGCFDILHPGHFSIISEAKKMCKNLYIALNSDSSVSNLKGQSRPINNFNKRKHNLIKLGLVKEVTEFNESTPVKLLKRINPDVFFKGGDYTGNEDFEDFNFCRENNIDLEVIKYLEGFSSSDIIKRKEYEIK